jgi:hypothetical protein
VGPAFVVHGPRAAPPSPRPRKEEDPLKAFFKDSGLSDAEQTLICSSLGVKDIKDFAYVEEADINAIDLRPVPKNKLRRALQQWADSQKPPAEEPELNGDSVVLPVESKPPALFPRGKTYDDELLASKQREEREAKKSRKKSEVSLTDDSYTESVPATPSVRGAAISGGSAAERRLSAGTEKTAATAVTAGTAATESKSEREQRDERLKKRHEERMKLRLEQNERAQKVKAEKEQLAPSAKLQKSIRAVVAMKAIGGKSGEDKPEGDKPDQPRPKQGAKGSRAAAPRARVASSSGAKRDRTAPGEISSPGTVQRSTLQDVLQQVWTDGQGDISINGDKGASASTADTAENETVRMSCSRSESVQRDPRVLPGPRVLPRSASAASNVGIMGSDVRRNVYLPPTSARALSPTRIVNPGYPRFISPKGPVNAGTNPVSFRRSFSPRASPVVAYRSLAPALPMP